MPRILVVDDEEEIRTLLYRFFTKKNYKVRTAETAEEAIGVLESERVDAVLLDIKLPGTSGLDALGKIRASWPDLPVVMISGQDDEEVAKEALKAGAFDYVVKPLDFDYLERTVYLKLVERLA
jgi:DNA-binding response OmpR family regulator